MKRDIGSLLARSGSALGKTAPMFKELDQCIEKIELVIDSLSSESVTLGYGIHRLRGLAKQTTISASNVETLIQVVTQTAGSAHEFVHDLHAAVADIGGDVLAAVRSVKAQVEYAGGFLHGTGGLARRRLGQIDRALRTGSRTSYWNRNTSMGNRFPKTAPDIIYLRGRAGSCSCGSAGPFEHAHRNLVAHRDLKPGNILVTAGGQQRETAKLANK